jgi:hypothetical protein
VAFAGVRLGNITFRAAGAAPDADGDRFTCRDLPGWTGAPVQMVTVEKPLSDGAVMVFGRRTARGVSVIGHAIAANADAVWRVRNKLEACVQPNANSTLYVDEPAGTKTLVVRLAAAIQVRTTAASRVVEFEIPLIAVNPTKA